MINICVFGMFCGLLLKYGEACNFVEAFRFKHRPYHSLTPYLDYVNEFKL